MNGCTWEEIGYHTSSGLITTKIKQHIFKYFPNDPCVSSTMHNFLTNCECKRFE